MVRVFVALTCGISILQNLLEIPEFRDLVRKTLTIPENVDIRQVLRGSLVRKLRNEALQRGEVFESALKYLKENPVRYSAELNTLIKLVRKLRHETSLEHVICQILASDTDTGHFCARLIETYLAQIRKIEDIPISVDSIVNVRGLVDSPGDVVQALSTLADRFARKMFQYAQYGYDLYTIITGGFKIEASYITALASLAKSKIVYCPDPSSDVLILPPLPIDLDPEVVRLVANGEISPELAEKYVRLGLAEVCNGKVKLKPWLRLLISIRQMYR